MSVGAAYVDIHGNWSQFQSEVQQHGERAARSLSERLSGAGDSLQRFGSTMTRRVTLPIVAAGAGVLRTAAGFEQSMNQVRAVTGATGDEFDALSGLARDLGSSTMFSASEAAEAMYFLSSAGFDTEQIMSALPSVLDLAAAGNMDLARASDIASNVLSGMGREAGDLAQINDVLVGTFQRSNTNVSQLGEAFSYVAPIAAALGIPIEEVSGAVGVLGDAGIQGSRAGRSLASAFQRLVSPTDAGAQALEDLGVAVYDASGQLRPFEDIVRDLAGAGADVETVFTIFGEVAGRSMLALIENADGLQDLTGSLYDVEGAAREVADIQMEGLAGNLAELRSALEGLALAVADSGLLQMATDWVSDLADRIRRLAETDPERLRLIVGALAGLAIVGPAARIAGTLLKGLALILSPKGLLIVGIAALAAGIGAVVWEFLQHGTLASDFRAQLVDLAEGTPWESIVGSIDSIAASIEDLYNDTPGWLQGFVESFRTNLSWIPLIANTQFGLYSGALAALRGDTKAFQEANERIFQGIYDFISGIFTRLGIDMPDDWRTAVGNLVEAIQDTFEQIREAVQEFIREMMSPFSGIGERFSGIGGTIARSLASGMSSRTGTVTTVAGRLASAAWRAARARLGIGSPSKVFEEVGRDVVAGMTGGLQSGFPDVERTAGRLARAASATAGTVGQVRSMMTFGDINVGTADDGQRMVYEVRKLAELYA